VCPRRHGLRRPCWHQPRRWWLVSHQARHCCSPPPPAGHTGGWRPGQARATAAAHRSWGAAGTQSAGRGSGAAAAAAAAGDGVAQQSRGCRARGAGGHAHPGRAAVAMTEQRGSDSLHSERLVMRLAAAAGRRRHVQQVGGPRTHASACHVCRSPGSWRHSARRRHGQLTTGSWHRSSAQRCGADSMLLRAIDAAR